MFHFHLHVLIHGVSLSGNVILCRVRHNQNDIENEKRHYYAGNCNDDTKFEYKTPAYLPTEYLIQRNNKFNRVSRRYNIGAVSDS